MSYEEVLVAFVLGTIISLLISYILSSIGLWKILEKTGEAGWPALIPIYNHWVLCKKIGVNQYWVVAVLIIGFIPVVGTVLTPIASLYFYALLYVSTARSFGKEDVFAIGLFLLSPIFYLILGFGKSEYLGARPLSDPIFDALGINKKKEKVTEAEVVTEEKVVKEEEKKEVDEPIITKEKYCLNCGVKIDDDSKFCTNCGKKL